MIIDIQLEGEITDVEYEEIEGQIIALIQPLGINGTFSRRSGTFKK